MTQRMHTQATHPSPPCAGARARYLGACAGAVRLVRQLLSERVCQARGATPACSAPRERLSRAGILSVAGGQCEVGAPKVQRASAEVATLRRSPRAQPAVIFVHHLYTFDVELVAGLPTTEVRAERLPGMQMSPDFSGR
jgi:hypothetical protein